MLEDDTVTNASKAIPERSIVIIGGGIIGTCIAYYLAKATHETNPRLSITILEANDIASGASGKAAGFLAKDWHSGSTSSLGLLSYNLHASLAQELNGEEVYGYRRLKCFGGSIELDRENPSEDQQPVDHIIYVPPPQPTRTHPSPLDSSASSSSIDSDSPTWLRDSEHFPLVSDEETTAQLHPYLFTRAIFQECLKLGVKYLRGCASSWSREESILKLNVISASGREGGETEPTSSSLSIPATSLIIAAGPWSKRVANDLLGISIPISYLPGHSLILQAPPSSLRHAHAHSAFIEFRGKSQDLANMTQTPEVFLRPDGTIYVAGENTGPPLPDGTKEADDLINPAAIDKLRRSVQLAGIQGTEFREQLCYRPLTQRGVPLIGKLGDDIYVATGHGPWGISLAPGTGKVVSELVLAQNLSADISSLEPAIHGIQI